MDKKFNIFNYLYHDSDTFNLKIKDIQGVT